MKATTEPQPIASLVALGVKTILDKPRPTKYRGRIAIHAGKHPVEHCGTVGDVQTYRQACNTMLVPGRLCPPSGKYDLLEGGTWVDLPLGAVIATATLADCVPVVDVNGDECDGTCVVLNGAKAHIDHAGELRLTNISDQLPYGDFQPGRWAWLLEDVQPTTTRCPACWGTGERLAANGLQIVCICGDAGHCAPVPAKGRPGLWEWSPT